jgi:hypothetical protein
MRELVEDAWAFCVPKRVAEEYAASRAATTSRAGRFTLAGQIGLRDSAQLGQLALGDEGDDRRKYAHQRAVTTAIPSRAAAISPLSSGTPLARSDPRRSQALPRRSRPPRGKSGT